MQRKLIRKRHGNTFLTRPRWVEKDVLKAEKSPFTWGYNKVRGCYTLSLLGVLNGLLKWIRLVVYCDVNRTTKEITKWHMVRKF